MPAGNNKSLASRAARPAALMIIFSLTILTQCLTMGASSKAAAPTPENLALIKSGMTPDEVRSILGPPIETRQTAGGQRWAYNVYDTAGLTTRVVVLSNDIVVEVTTDLERQLVARQELSTRREISDEISKAMDLERKREAENKRKEELEKEALLIKKREQELREKELSIRQAREDFERFYITLGLTQYAYNRYDMLSQSLGSYYVTCSQVVRIMDSFYYVSEKMKALRMMRYRILDPENRSLITNSFSVYSSRVWAQNVLNGYD